MSKHTHDLITWAALNPRALVHYQPGGARVYRYFDCDRWALYHLRDYFVVSVVSGPGIVLARRAEQ
jgi:hypothetical protein